MTFKEKTIIELNEVIYSKKSKLSIKDREILIVIREEIRKQKSKKGLSLSLKALAGLLGFKWGDDSEDED